MLPPGIYHGNCVPDYREEQQVRQVPCVAVNCRVSCFIDSLDGSQVDSVYELDFDALNKHNCIGAVDTSDVQSISGRKIQAPGFRGFCREAEQ